mgnify:FL=1
MTDDGTVLVGESLCVNRVVLIQPEEHVNPNITRWWVNAAVPNMKFGYRKHLKTALCMIAVTIRDK